LRGTAQIRDSLPQRRMRAAPEIRAQFFENQGLSMT
jgi:hypothetical protein